MTVPCYTSDDFLAQLQNLLPTGPAYPRLPETVQTKLLNAFADALETEGDRDCNLLVDAFPSTTTELIGEWEQTLGLPDPCLPPDASIIDRRRSVVARLTADGGQSIPYLLSVARALGYPYVTFTEFTPFRTDGGLANFSPPYGPDYALHHFGEPLYGSNWAYTLYINNFTLQVERFEFGINTFGTPFASWKDDVLLCELRRLIPGHVNLLFDLHTESSFAVQLVGVTSNATANDFPAFPPPLAPIIDPLEIMNGISVNGSSGTTSAKTNAISTSANDTLILVSMNTQATAGSFVTVSGVTGGGLTFTRLASVYDSGVAGGGVNGQFSNGQWMSLELWAAWAPIPLVNQSFTVNISQNTSVLLSTLAIQNAFSALAPFDPNGGLPATGDNWQGPVTINYSTTNATDLVLMYSAGAGFTQNYPAGTTHVVNWAGAGSIYIHSIAETAPVVSGSVILGNAGQVWGTNGIIIAVTANP